MASEDIDAFSQALTADGGTDGYVSVADSSGFYPGAHAWLSSDTANQYCVITEVKDSTTIGLRFQSDPGGALRDPLRYPSYKGRSDCSAFTLAANARVDMPAQLVRVIQPTFSKFGRV